MAGGLINIVSYGAQDLYLTGEPQITFFKIVYRRHTNFSLESIRINIDDSLNFNKKSQIVIPTIADGIHKGFLEITLPQFFIPKVSLGYTVPTSMPNDLTSSYVQDYLTVTNFMAINMQSYRTCYNELLIQNTTVINIVQDGLTVFNIASNAQTITNYSALIGTTPIFLEANSNLNIILNKMKTDIINGITYTKNQFFIILANVVTECTTVQNYFFKRLIDYTDVVADYVSPNFKFAWIPKIGHAIIDYIDVFIGGEKIDRHYGIWIDIWYQLTANDLHTDAYNKIIGNVPELTTFDRNIKPQYTLYIPLTFWFNKFNGLAFPLVALQYSDLVFVIKLKSMSECSYMELLTSTPNYTTQTYTVYTPLDDIWNNSNSILSGGLTFDYVFLDQAERRKFAQSAHEYLIEIVQVITIKNIKKVSQLQAQLDGFRHPTKELYWVAQKNEWINNESSSQIQYPNLYCLNVDGTGNPFTSCSISFNGYSRINNFDSSFYNYYQSFSHHNHTPNDGINTYSFCIYPEMHQPSGTCNFSKITNPQISFTLDPSAFTYNLSDVTPTITKGSTEDLVKSTNITIWMFALSYNILRVIGGFGKLAYS